MSWLKENAGKSCSGRSLFRYRRYGEDWRARSLLVLFACGPTVLAYRSYTDPSEYVQLSIVTGWILFHGYGRLNEVSGFFTNLLIRNGSSLATTNLCLVVVHHCGACMAIGTILRSISLLIMRWYYWYYLFLAHGTTWGMVSLILIFFVCKCVMIREIIMRLLGSRGGVAFDILASYF